MILFQELNSKIGVIKNKKSNGDDLMNAVEKYSGMLDGLANPLRLSIFAYLRSHGPSSLSKLQKQFPMKRNVLNHHLTILSDRYLIWKKRQGRQVVYHINDDVFAFMAAYLKEVFGKNRRVRTIAYS